MQGTSASFRTDGFEFTINTNEKPKQKFLKAVTEITQDQFLVGRECLIMDK